MGALVVDPARSASDPYTPDRGDPAYAVSHYDLNLDYKVSSNRLAGRATLEIVAQHDLTWLVVDLVGLRIAKITVDGLTAKWTHRGPRVVVTPARPLAGGDLATMVITYAGAPRPVSTRWGYLGWEELSDGVLVAAQPSGAATWFPCNDHPRHKSTFTVAFECDSPFAVLATGALSSRRTRGSRTRHVFEQPVPMATYLAAIHVGRYQRRELVGGTVPVRVALPQGSEQSVMHDLARLPDMTHVFSGLFGDYPFGDYTVVVTADDLEIPLEAHGMATFGRNWLDGRRRHERLVAHELAHQWFGNSLTLTTWADIWLNEGFACYAEWLWAEYSDKVPAQRNAEVHWQELERSPQNMILADPGPDLMFDDRVYKRGALTLHQLRRLLGDAPFFDMLRAWAAANRHGSVTTSEFMTHVRSCSESTGGEELSRSTAHLLKRWLWEPALPQLTPAS